MPTKSVKKTATKKTAAKKATVKKTVKPATVKENITSAPVTETQMCKCGADCKCAHHGSKFGRCVIKLIIVLIIFALGFAAAKFVEGDRDFRGPRVEFDDGCLDVSSVDCPQLQALLPVMDVDHNGCITHAEYRAVSKEFGRQMRAGNGRGAGFRAGMRN